MTGRVNKMDSPIQGVKCVVNTCHYWGNDHCHAQTIEIQAPNAKTSEMTDCATFAPSDMR
ncbi:DUF1540 domain-containing protein [Desulfitobacterium chlororespirans]|uniref:DUF1540 domain-containing protein n=1 Tax=Desulfitobacterium chlororespirans DSM 11544 TaxID=1121395 RepID=A0A1M7UQG1_9FIRM|nr:DUF1540 domain-containing protein [Desulfitobacterium chlororespirans]SHN85117.1 protein of unknown function [Desulfitobacterium chlororespirans DSM 11544]